VPERYGTPYPHDAHVYSRPTPPPAPQRYPGPYGSSGVYLGTTAPPAVGQQSASPGPQVYSRPVPSPAPEPERYPDRDVPQAYPPTGSYPGG
jgi:hypothetical protein